MYFVREQYSRGMFNGVNKIAAVIDADTAEDLPAYNDCTGVDGELTLGTVGFVAAEVAFYAMTSDGEWHKQGEEPDSNKSSLNSVSPALIKASVTPDEKSDEKSLEDMPEEYYTEDSEPLTKVSDEDAELL